MLCREGDFVPGDSVLATSDRFDEIRVETSAIRLEETGREMEDEADLAEFQGEFSRTLAGLVEDSLALVRLMTMVNEGFVPQSLLEGASQQVLRRKETLRTLLSQEDVRRSRNVLRHDKISMRLRRLAEEMERTRIRAPGPAVVHSIKVGEGRLTNYLKRR